jgi:hypothetical protein
MASVILGDTHEFKRDMSDGELSVITARPQGYFGVIGTPEVWQPRLCRHLPPPPRIADCRVTAAPG